MANNKIIYCENAGTCLGYKDSRIGNQTEIGNCTGIIEYDLERNLYFPLVEEGKEPQMCKALIGLNFLRACLDKIAINGK